MVAYGKINTRLSPDASKYMQKYFNFDATFVRKPMPLLETWRDVVMIVILAEPITEAFKNTALLC